MFMSPWIKLFIYKMTHIVRPNHLQKEIPGKIWVDMENDW